MVDMRGVDEIIVSIGEFNVLSACSFRRLGPRRRNEVIDAHIGRRDVMVADNGRCGSRPSGSPRFSMSVKLRRPLPVSGLAPEIQGAPHDGRPSRLERDLSSLHHGELGHSRRIPRSGASFRSHGVRTAAEPGGQSIVEGGVLRYRPGRLEEKARELRKTPDNEDHERSASFRPGRPREIKVFPPRRAACRLHALSISDFPKRRSRFSSCTSSRCRAHHLHESSHGTLLRRLEI